jgi:hypothetical protein
MFVFTHQYLLDAFTQIYSNAGMNRRNRNMYLSIILMSGVFTFLVLINPIFYSSTGESSQEVRQNNTNSKKVLGANSTKSDNQGCTSEKPIIGWIDYSGKKTLQYSLPEGEKPSSCFGTIEEGNKEGYFYQ